MSDVIRQRIIGVPQIGTSLKKSEGTILKILEVAKLLGHRGGISQSSC